MKINRLGITRTVFVFKNIVIKVPNYRYSWQHFLKGILANIHENDTWKLNSGKYEKGKSYLLCPVIWCSWGGWILVMKRAKTLTDEEWETTWSENRGFITEHKMHFEGDDTVSNYGILNDKVVKIDYGQ